MSFDQLGYGIYGAVILLGSGQSTLVILSMTFITEMITREEDKISASSSLSSSSSSTAGFVFGFMSTIEKISGGVAIAIIQNVGVISDPGAFYRNILVSICSATSGVGIGVVGLHFWLNKDKLREGGGVHGGVEETEEEEKEEDVIDDAEDFRQLQYAKNESQRTSAVELLSAETLPDCRAPGLELPSIRLKTEENPTVSSKFDKHSIGSSTHQPPTRDAEIESSRDLESSVQRRSARKRSVSTVSRKRNASVVSITDESMILR